MRSSRSLPLALVAFPLLAVGLGLVRQQFPRGIAWSGRWPTALTKAEDAYKMMAKPGDAPFVSLADAVQAHDKNEATFIDARAHQEFVAGHIPGARNLPYYELDKYQDSALQGLAADAPIIIYCEGVGCELSFFLSREMKSGGFTNMRIFYGGYPEWKEAGLPIERERTQ